MAFSWVQSISIGSKNTKLVIDEIRNNIDIVNNNIIYCTAHYDTHYATNYISHLSGNYSGDNAINNTGHCASNYSYYSTQYSSDCPSNYSYCSTALTGYWNAHVGGYNGSNCSKI